MSSQPLRLGLGSTRVRTCRGGVICRRRCRGSRCHRCRRLVRSSGRRSGRRRGRIGGRAAHLRPGEDAHQYDDDDCQPRHPGLRGAGTRLVVDIQFRTKIAVRTRVVGIECHGVSSSSFCRENDVPAILFRSVAPAVRTKVKRAADEERLQARS